MNNVHRPILLKVMVHFISYKQISIKNMPDKKKLVKEFIQKNPNLSGNEAYQETKALGIGIRKTNFYSVFRETKELSQPSIKKKVKSIPIKYRTIDNKITIKEYELNELKRVRVGKDSQKIREVVKEITKLEKEKEKEKPFYPLEVETISIPKKEGSYGITEIIDDNTKTSYWIKYTNKKDYNRQLDIIKAEYPKIKKIISHGKRKFIAYIEPKYKKLLKK